MHLTFYIAKVKHILEEFQPYEQIFEIPNIFDNIPWEKLLRENKYSKKAFDELPSTYRIVNKTNPLCLEAPVWKYQTWLLWKIFQTDNDEPHKMLPWYLKAYRKESDKPFLLQQGIRPRDFRYKNIPFNDVIRSDTYKESTIVLSDETNQQYYEFHIIHKKQINPMIEIIDDVKTQIPNYSTVISNNTMILDKYDAKYIADNHMDEYDCERYEDYDYDEDDELYYEDPLPEKHDGYETEEQNNSQEFSDEDMAKYTWRKCLLQDILTPKIIEYKIIPFFKNPEKYNFLRTSNRHQRLHI